MTSGVIIVAVPVLTVISNVSLFNVKVISSEAFACNSALLLISVAATSLLSLVDKSNVLPKISLKNSLAASPLATTTNPPCGTTICHLE